MINLNAKKKKRCTTISRSKMSCCDGIVLDELICLCADDNDDYDVDNDDNNDDDDDDVLRQTNTTNHIPHSSLIDV